MQVRYTFSKTSQYSLLPAQSFAEHIDALYVDGLFFEKNLPIIGAELDMSMSRSGDLGPFWLTLFMPTYSAGMVENTTIGGGLWNFGVMELNQTFVFPNTFYGMGVNTIDVRMSPVTGYVIEPLIVTINWTLKVEAGD